MHFFPHIHTDNFLLPVSIYTRQINSWSFLVILVGEYRDQTVLKLNWLNILQIPKIANLDLYNILLQP